ncbi:MAG: TadE/TadG family type IV pilus assembly protein [Acidiferrobacter sp.]
MAEFVVALPVLILLLLGALQMGLLFTTHTTVTLAAFDAVRAASENGGAQTALENGLARGLSPLYAHGSSATAVSIAEGEALAAVKDPQTVAVSLLNPPPAVVKAWAQSVTHDGTTQKEIPNARLLFASATVRAGETLPDANVLKIRVRYCAPLIVPFIAPVIATLEKAWSPSPFTLACANQPGLPVSVVATALMQSPLLKANANALNQGTAVPGTAPTTGGGGTTPGTGGSGTPYPSCGGSPGAYSAGGGA